MSDKRTETSVTNFKIGIYEIYVYVRKVSERIVGYVIIVFKGIKQVFHKAYPDIKKAMVAFDGWVERAIKETTGAKVDFPLVKG